MKTNAANRQNQHSYRKHAFSTRLLFVLFLFLIKPFIALSQIPDEEPIAINEGREQESFDEIDCKELLAAVKERNSEKVRELLNTADPNCINFNLKRVEVQKGQTFFVQDPRTPLVAAARDGNLEAGKFLTEAGADVEFHAPGDESPLMAASANGNLDFVKLLIANGADVNKKLSGDGTALIVASRGGHAETVKYLLSQGAEVDGMVNTDGTPLINAVRRGHYEVSKILLENGADPYFSTPCDEYPMYHARESKNRIMIELLKKYEKVN